MADKRIIDLPELLALASADEFVVWDQSTASTKRVALSLILAAASDGGIVIPAPISASTSGPTYALDVDSNPFQDASITMTGNVAFSITNPVDGGKYYVVFSASGADRILTLSGTNFINGVQATDLATTILSGDSIAFTFNRVGSSWRIESIDRLNRTGSVSTTLASSSSITVDLAGKAKQNDFYLESNETTITFTVNNFRDGQILILKVKKTTASNQVVILGTTVKGATAVTVVGTIDSYYQIRLEKQGSNLYPFVMYF